MHGIPMQLSTAEDYENAHALALSGVQVQRMRNHWNGLLNTRQQYVFNQVLASEEDRTGPEPDYRVLTGQGENGDEIHEFALTDDPKAKMHQLGYTEADVNARLTELEGM